MLDDREYGEGARVNIRHMASFAASGEITNSTAPATIPLAKGEYTCHQSDQNQLCDKWQTQLTYDNLPTSSQHTASAFRHAQHAAMKNNHLGSYLLNDWSSKTQEAMMTYVNFSSSKRSNTLPSLELLYPLPNHLQHWIVKDEVQFPSSESAAPVSAVMVIHVFCSIISLHTLLNCNSFLVQLFSLTPHCGSPSQHVGTLLTYQLLSTPAASPRILMPTEA